jgi:hypothetical protein
MLKQNYFGPNGIELRLDRSDIDPDNITDAIKKQKIAQVHKTVRGLKYEGSYWAVVLDAELDCQESGKQEKFHALNPQEMQWLRGQEPEIERFLFGKEITLENTPGPKEAERDQAWVEHQAELAMHEGFEQHGNM